jgi:hypothetical protein
MKRNIKNTNNNLNIIHYVLPAGFTPIHKGKLICYLVNRFRFNTPIISITNGVISISFEFGKENPKELISEYVSGFLDAI